MSHQLPEVKYVYQNGSTLDSLRWKHYIPRDGDIVISTAPKSGTTWMQNIVMHLIFQDLKFRHVFDVFPWVENSRAPIDEVIAKLDAQTHRRSIKSHMPLDGLIYHTNVKYIVVSRDARDTFMSMWNHYKNSFEMKTKPACPDTIHEFWHW